MDSIEDAKTIYQNSGIYNWSHENLVFIEDDFVQFFWENYDNKDYLVNAFVLYMSEANNTTPEQIISDYSIKNIIR